MSIIGNPVVTSGKSAKRLNETIYNANIAYTNWTGNTPSSISLGTYHADAESLIIEAVIDDTYAGIWTRYILKKGTTQYGYIVAERYSDASHQVVLLLITRTASGELIARPYRCNTYGTKKTVIKIIGTSNADLWDDDL